MNKEVKPPTHFGNLSFQQLAVGQGGKNTFVSDSFRFCQDCAKGAKDEVKRHEWPPARSQGP